MHMNYREQLQFPTTSSSSSASDSSSESSSAPPSLTYEMENNMEELRNQNAQLQALIQQQQHEINTHRLPFVMNPAQIIETFNSIKSFSGDEDSYQWRTFRRAVNGAISLCGDQDVNLRTYCLNRVVNTKIVGSAASLLLEMPNDNLTWEAVVEFLEQRYRPRGTTCDLIYKARITKVLSLEDMFTKFHQIKLQANEIFYSNGNDKANMTNFDNELVKIVKTKMLGQYQVQVQPDMTLEQLDRHCESFETYQDINVIKPEDRINANRNNNRQENQIYTNSNSYNNQNNRFNRYNNNNYGNNNNTQQYRNSNNGNNGSNYRNNNTQNTSNNRNYQPTNNQQYNNQQNYRAQPNNNSQHNNQQQFHQQPNQPNAPWGNQFNNSNRFQNSQQPNNNTRPEPMELGSLDHDQKHFHNSVPCQYGNEGPANFNKPSGSQTDFSEVPQQTENP